MFIDMAVGQLSLSLVNDRVYCQIAFQNNVGNVLFQQLRNIFRAGGCVALILQSVLIFDGPDDAGDYKPKRQCAQR